MSEPRTLRRSERIDADRVDALRGLISATDFEPSIGAVLPPMWHVAFFLPRPAQHDLGPDGHPLHGIPSAPEPGMRRMFAGGRVRLTPGLAVGTEATATTQVSGQRVVERDTRRMTFVTTATAVSVDGATVLHDERDIVYVNGAPSQPGSKTADEEAAASRPADDGKPPPTTRRDVVVDPVLLFRFSALTYNAHRIHYDRDYARDVEGHPSLVVHGPLQALLMAEEGHRLLGRYRGHVSMDYRLTSPLYEHDGLVVVASQIDDRTAQVRVETAAGRVTAQAQLTATGPH